MTGAERAHVPGIEQQIVWVYTDDLAVTTAFYADTLGLELLVDQGQCHIYRTTAGARLGVCRARPGRQVEPRGVLITFVTPAVDAWYQRLRAAGADVDAPPGYVAAFDIYAFMARDPNGYRIEFQHFGRPS